MASETNSGRAILITIPRPQYFDGFAADAISPERVARWADPAGAIFMRCIQPSGVISPGAFTGKDPQGGLTKEGGWQNNRGGAVHQKIRFVEKHF